MGTADENAEKNIALTMTTVLIKVCAVVILLKNMKLCTLWSGPLTVKSLKNSYLTYYFRTNGVQ